MGNITAYLSFMQDDLRRRREEQQVEIRRQKREENITKKRNFQFSTGYDSDDDGGTSSWEAPVSSIAQIHRICLYLCYFSSRKRWSRASCLMTPIAN